MKKSILALLTLFAGLMGVAPRAYAGVPPTYVDQVRLTVPASPANVLAFQNTSAGLDVVVRRIEIVTSSTQSVTGGLMQFLVYASTQVTHSASAGKFYAYGSANASRPSHISVSTAPLSVQFEGDSAALTAAQLGAMSGALPLIRPLVVNNDEGAAANFGDAWAEESPNSPNPAGGLLLPAGANRALIFEKRQLGSSDFSAGQVIIRIFYTIR